MACIHPDSYQTMSVTMGLLHGLGLYPAKLISLSDIGDFPRSAKAMIKVLKGKSTWWVASATLRSELKGSVPSDPIGKWFHDGKEYAKAALSELQEEAETMEKGEAVYFRLGVVSSLSKKGAGDKEKLKIVLGADFCPVFNYIDSK